MGFIYYIMEIEINFTEDILYKKIPEDTKVTGILNITNPGFIYNMDYYGKLKQKFPDLNKIGLNFTEKEYNDYNEKYKHKYIHSIGYVKTVLISCNFIPYLTLDFENLAIGTTDIIIDLFMFNLHKQFMLILPDYFIGTIIGCGEYPHVKIGVSANFVNWANVPKCSEIHFIGCCVSQSQIDSASACSQRVYSVNGQLLKKSKLDFLTKNNIIYFAKVSYIVLFIGVIIGVKYKYK